MYELKHKSQGSDNNENDMNDYNSEMNVMTYRF